MQRIEMAEKLINDYGGNNDLLLSDLYFTRALHLFYMDKFIESNEYFLKSIKIYDDIGLISSSLEAKIYIAMSFFFNKEEAKSINQLTSVVKDEKISNQSKSLANILLYRIYITVYLPKKSLNFLLETINNDIESMLTSFQFLVMRKNKNIFTGQLQIDLSGRKFSSFNVRGRFKVLN